MELLTGEFAQGSLRSDGTPTQTFFNLSTSSNMSRNASLNAKEIRSIFTVYFSMKDKHNGSGNTAESLFPGKVNKELELVTIGFVRIPSNIYDGAFLRK